MPRPGALVSSIPSIFPVATPRAPRPMSSPASRRRANVLLNCPIGSAISIPNTRYRFLAGAFLPADWYVKAQQFRRWYSQQLAGLFQNWDVILAPVAPVPAPSFADQSTIIDSKELALRPLLGRFVQALAPAGLPIVVAPFVKRPTLPVGVQIIAAPFREDHAFRVAAALENSGLFGPRPH